MSGTFPTAGFSTMDFTSNVNNRVSKSVSGKVQRLKVGAQFWSFKLKSPPLSKADFKQIFPFIVKQDGQFGTFTVVPPNISSTTGTATGTITISDDYAAGVTECRSTGGSGNLKKGDLIKFSNHNKVYMLTEDINLNQTDSSEDVISFYPNLVTAITSTTTVTYNNVPFNVYFDEDQQSFTTQTDGTYRYELNCIEEI
jgi:hypothetical protein